MFGALYADEARLEQFLAAMASLQTGNFSALASRFDFSKRKTVLDVGGANGHLSRILAAHHPHLSLLSFDLPAVAPIARRELAKAGLVSRIEVVVGDFFVDPLPSADVIVTGNILHDWNEADKQRLIGVAGEHLTGAQMAAGLARALERPVAYQDVPPSVYRSFGFPGADDLGNMFQYKAEFEREYGAARSVAESRALNPELLTFAAWLAKYKAKIPLS